MGAICAKVESAHGAVCGLPHRLGPVLHVHDACACTQKMCAPLARRQNLSRRWVAANAALTTCIPHTAPHAMACTRRLAARHACWQWQGKYTVRPTCTRQAAVDRAGPRMSRKAAHVKYVRRTVAHENYLLRVTHTQAVARIARITPLRRRRGVHQRKHRACLGADSCRNCVLGTAVTAPGGSDRGVNLRARTRGHEVEVRGQPGVVQVLRGPHQALDEGLAEARERRADLHAARP